MSEKVNGWEVMRRRLERLTGIAWPEWSIYSQGRWVARTAPGRPVMRTTAVNGRAPEGDDRATLAVEGETGYRFAAVEVPATGAPVDEWQRQRAEVAVAVERWLSADRRLAATAAMSAKPGERVSIHAESIRQLALAADVDGDGPPEEVVGRVVARIELGNEKLAAVARELGGPPDGLAARAESLERLRVRLARIVNLYDSAEPDAILDAVCARVADAEKAELDAMLLTGDSAGRGAPDPDPTRPQRERGLEAKFRVTRADGRDRPGGDRAGARYLVLDAAHDPHAAAALLAYRDAVADDYPQLARDIAGMVSEEARLVDDERRAELDRAAELLERVTGSGPGTSIMMLARRAEAIAADRAELRTADRRTRGRLRAALELAEGDPTPAAGMVDALVARLHSGDAAPGLAPRLREAAARALRWVGDTPVARSGPVRRALGLLEAAEAVEEAERRGRAALDGAGGEPGDAADDEPDRPRLRRLMTEPGVFDSSMPDVLP